MRIAICDDEKAARKILTEKAERIAGEADCPGEVEIRAFASGEELLRERDLPDIAFLDIRMPGEDGMEVARRLREQSAEMVLIFVTAEEGRVYDAFDVGAFQFLVKPYSDARLREVLFRAMEKVREESERAMLREDRPSLMVYYRGVHEKIPFDEIVYAEANRRKIILHRPGAEVEYYGKFTDLEKLLGDGFFRCHRAFIVNFAYVVRYEADCVHLRYGEAMMSKAKYPDFIAAFLKYHLQSGGEKGS